MTTLNRQQSTIIKLDIHQTLNNFGIEADAIKKKVGTNYK